MAHAPHPPAKNSESLKPSEKMAPDPEAPPTIHPGDPYPQEGETIAEAQRRGSAERIAGLAGLQPPDEIDPRTPTSKR